MQPMGYMVGSNLVNSWSQDLELALAMAVERELGEDSAWWPYLRLLECSLVFFVHIVSCVTGRCMARKF